jgi:hypothetical protein
MNRPQPDEYNVFYQRYIDTVSIDVLTELRNQGSLFADFVLNIPKEKGDFAYVAGKWTVKELIGHVIDTERIMACRALRIGRNDPAPMPGFDENEYTRAAHYGNRSLESLGEEFKALRTANMFLFQSFTEEELCRTGTASGHRISCRALLFIIAGHLNHHWNILRERYL